MLTRLTLGLPLVELGEADAGHRSFQIFMRTGYRMAVRHLVSSNGCGFILRVLMFVVLSFYLFLFSSTFSVFLNSSSFLPPRFSSSSSSLFSFFLLLFLQILRPWREAVRGGRSISAPTKKHLQFLLLLLLIIFCDCDRSCGCGCSSCSSCASLFSTHRCPTNSNLT